MPDNNPHIRHRVQLPDGKHVEIVYRDHLPASEGTGADPACAAEPPAVIEPLSTPAPETFAGTELLHGHQAGGPDPLHICFNCAGEFVYPLDWAEEGERHWRIVLRCPDCESYREGVFEQSVVERLDDELDRATNDLLGDLKRITHANMADEIDFFVRALHADLIVPSDFHR